MTVPFADAFRGGTVLVTGHTGFKGSWLCLWLDRLGAQVTGYALAPSTKPNNFEVSDVAAALTAHHEGDVRDLERVAHVVEAARPDVVLHLAAQPLVRTGLAEPHETFATNVMGTATVLEAVRRAQRPCAVVVVTSDKCYENVDQVWGYREIDPMGGDDPYSASKGAAELVTAAYRRSFFSGDSGVLVASARAGNVIGGGDWSADRIVPDTVRALTRDEPLAVRSPSSVRPWQHVLEPLCGYLTLAARLLDGDAGACAAWNFGPTPGSEVPVSVLVERFLVEWGGGRWEDHSATETVREAGQLRLTIDKAAVGLGWRPRWGFEETVRRTARWYRRHEEGDGPVRQACLDDIAAYEEAQ